MISDCYFILHRLQLTCLSNFCPGTLHVLNSWKLPNVQLIPKKVDLPVNHRTFLFTSILCKTIKRVLKNRLLANLKTNGLLTNQYYRFHRNKSTEDILVYIMYIWNEAMKERGETLAISLDNSKAFDQFWITLR